MLIDTHGHVNFNAFREDGEEVLRRTLAQGIWVVMPGSQYSTSKRSVEIAERYGEGVYAAIGLHPIHLGKRKTDVLEVQSENSKEESWMTFETRGEDFDSKSYRELAQSKKVVAVGEVGLDYYYKPKGKTRQEEFKQKQKEVLRAQIDLALEFNLPVIFHCRVAHDDLLALLEEYGERRPSGVIHSYTGNLEQTKRFLDLGYSFGFNGLIFKQVQGLNPQEVISFLPLDRIVLETDAPYLNPPMAEGERNEPLNVRYVAEEIARIKGVSFEQVATQTTQNAKALLFLA